MAYRTFELHVGWTGRQDLQERGRKDEWYAYSTADLGSSWVPVEIPAPMQRQFGRDAAPVCWYRRSLSPAELAREPGARVWLRLESAATEVTVWVNGRDVGRHVGDWVPFQFDITNALDTGATGSNQPAEIVVRVDRLPPTKEVWVEGGIIQGGHITKGFHDVLSLHKGGLWLPVHLDITGGVTLVPDGVGILADSLTGAVQVDLEFARNIGGGWIELDIKGPDGSLAARTRVELRDGADSAHAFLTVEKPHFWNPESPRLYTLITRIIDRTGSVSQQDISRFGFRRVEIGGVGGRQILLNGHPIFLSGILDWGHEPRHISPTATPDELRTRFAALRERGFNLVCICMWYAPRYFYDIADETGMLLWQEHPVWKSPMGDEHIPEYQRQFTKFFRRDRNHPSVVMVSGSCEHERFNPKLARWWWGRMRSLMPDRLAQIQTAFFAWTDLGKTDAYDEHTYDSSGRWTHYLENLQVDLDKLPPKPFVMGESILYTNWPDVAALTAQRKPGSPAPWWTPLGLDAVESFERRLIERFGRPTLDDFKRRARRYHLQGRKFQFELFRMHDRHAGVVMNHLRDVPACRCGFQDEQDTWYFTAEELSPWLSPAPLLLRTPQHLRGLPTGLATSIEIGVSNFSPSAINAPLTIACHGAKLGESKPSKLQASPGEVKWHKLSLFLPTSSKPSRVTLNASLPGAASNAWDLWSIPTPTHSAPGVARLASPAFDNRDRELDFEDRAYSSGWGSPVRTWTPLLPDPSALAPWLPDWNGEHATSASTRAVLAHKLTPPVVDFLVAGGRVVHLISRAAGSAPAKFVNMWGQLPLILEHGPLEAGDANWLADLLDHDLSRRSLRAIPVGELGLDESLEPIVRLVYCHDIIDRPKLFDFVSMARVGKGLLILSGVDHSTPAGEYFLQRLLDFAASHQATAKVELDESVVRGWACRT